MEESDQKNSGKQRRRRRRRKPEGDSNTAKAGPPPRERSAPQGQQRKRRRSKRPPDASDSSSPPQRARPATDDSGAVAHAAFSEVQPVMLPAVDYVPDDDEDDDATSEQGYGDDSDLPVEQVQLKPNLPLNPPADEPDPVTAELPQDQRFSTSPLANLVGIKFQTAGKIYLYDSGDTDYLAGERVVVESDRGNRIATVAVASARTSHRRQNLKRVIRSAKDADQSTHASSVEREQAILSSARQVARDLRLPAKVFRAELAAGKDSALIYFSTEEKVNTREFVRLLTSKLDCRVDVRQTGVRDEAKMVGGIGSCGQELCCTTWLPNFVPVSIKNAKDQGLVLNPTKVSGQCGRLKCCLIYEHSTYAELRQGMPKLGKRVVTEDGEGRVVEVDVLKQRIRVSLVDGDVKVYGKGEVQPLFPSQQPSGSPEGASRRGRRRPSDDPDGDPSEDED